MFNVGLRIAGISKRRTSATADFAFLLESGSGVILLESGDVLLKEGFAFTLEDGTGSIILEGGDNLLLES